MQLYMRLFLFFSDQYFLLKWVDLNCVNFCCTAKWFIYHILTYAFFFICSFCCGFSRDIGCSSLLYSRAVWFIPSLHGSVICWPTSHASPLPALLWGPPACPLGESNGTPLQHSRLENLMDGGAWWATVHGVAKSRTRLSDFTFTFPFHALEK